MAINAADTARLNAVLTTTLDRYSDVISNDLKRNEAVVAMFGANGRIKVVEGGVRAIETIDNVENPNFQFRNPTAAIDTNENDSRVQAKYAWATLDGAVNLNLVKLAQNAGSSQIYDLAEAELENANNTVLRKVADALRAATPGVVDPESIISMIPDTAQASQATSTGELSRATTPNWKSQYSNTSMPLTTTAGLASLQAFYLGNCAKGTSKKERPDFGITTPALYSEISAAFGDALKVVNQNSTMLELGFDNIKLFNATIVADPATTILSGDLRFLNTNYLKIQVLKTPGMKDVGDRPESIPVSVGPFQNAINGLNKVALMYIVFAMTCSSLQRQGIATNCS